MADTDLIHVIDLFNKTLTNDIVNFEQVAPDGSGVGGGGVTPYI